MNSFHDRGWLVVTVSLLSSEVASPTCYKEFILSLKFLELKKANDFLHTVIWIDQRRDIAMIKNYCANVCISILHCSAGSINKGVFRSGGEFDLHMGILFRF